MAGFLLRGINFFLLNSIVVVALRRPFLRSACVCHYVWDLMTYFPRRPVPALASLRRGVALCAAASVV
jgi:hypothetical protein